jgi:ribonuclease D
VSQAGTAAHMRPMTSLRDEAQNPETSPERLHELAHLEGDRGDIDSDAGWCREHVATNPNVALETLQELASDMNDVMARRNAASNPVLDDQSLWMMIEDKDDLTADAARERLGLVPKPRPNAFIRGVRIPVIDPKTGRVVKP